MTDRHAAEAEPQRLSDDRARAAAALDRKTRQTRLGMVIDRLIASLWPLFAAVIGFLAAARLDLFGLAASLGGAAARLGLLAAFAAAIIAAGVFAYRRFAAPSAAEARARLDEGHPDRPVASFDEEIALGRSDEDSERLWRAHQARIEARAKEIRARGPALKVGGRRDPWALRFLALLGLGAGFLLGQDAGGLRQVLAPVGASGLGGQEPSVEMWASPPVYTGAPPLYFENAEDRTGARSTPVGTVVSFRVFDAGGAPNLSLTPEPQSQGEGEDAPALIDQGGGVFAGEITLTEDTQVTLSAPGVLGAAPLVDLRFEVIEDTPPTVAYVEPPRRGAEAELAFSYTAGDDYGVMRAEARITLDETADAPTAPEPHEPLVIELPIPLNSAEADRLAGLDEEAPGEPVAETFFEHPWVGLPVTMTLIVEDASGQIAESEPAQFELPGRLFSEPMAKALIEQRGAVSWNVARAARANRILMAAIARPWDYFQRSGDFLVTRAAIATLDNAVTDGEVAENKTRILEALYAAASQLEDRGFDNARERLARAQRRLREAIENGASPEEIAELMEELREAIGEFLQALRELAERNPELAEKLMQQGQEGQSLSGQQLQEMLEALERAASDGDMSEAEQMLSMLEQLLNNLQPGGSSQQAGDGDPSGGEQDQSELERLQDMIEQQQRLAEESFDQFRQGQQGQQGQPGQQGQQGPGQQGMGQQGMGQQGQPGQQGRPGQQGQQGQAQGQAQRPGQGQGQQPGQDGQAGADRQGDRTGSGSAEDRARRDGLRRGAGPRSLDQMRRDQQSLRDALGALGRDLDAAGRAAGAAETPEEREARRRALERADEALDRAEEAMGRADQALGRGDAGDAAEQQMRAADAMRDGGRHAREALRGEDEEQLAEEEDRAGPSEEAGAFERGAFERERRDTQSDPLGRDWSEAAEGSGVDGLTGLRRQLLGEDGEGLSASQAREILDELRRRLGDRERTPLEREYLERLLERFR